MNAKSNDEMLKLNSTIFFNPKFKVHINPHFFNNIKAVIPSNGANNIFVNPKFINKLNSSNEQSNSVIQKSIPKAKIIKKTSRNLIREPMNIKSVTVSNGKANNQLIKIGQRKLIRPSSNVTSTNNDQIHDVHKKANIRSKYKIVNEKSLNVYKIDRRKLLKPVRDRGLKKIKIFPEFISPTKLVVTNYKLFRIGNPTSKFSKFNSTAFEQPMLNINGVLYKSTSTKLRKQSNTSISNKLCNNDDHSTNIGRSLYVRGEKFLLDPTGKRLERVSNNHSSILKNRIYLGGLTYIAKSNNTYERTNSHSTRLHLNVAKQKSINLLSRNLVKSNVSCPIFRKLGKCLALQRGRCTKIHDRNQVAICSKFLKGTCTNEKCLLSHDTSLSKMPTCKFFLLGQCSKADCPYLHKKVSDKTEVCRDFLKGYCPQAEKCNLRHEFLCPNYESKEGCTTARCRFVHKTKKGQTIAKGSTHRKPSPASIVDGKRYFVDNPFTDYSLSEEARNKLEYALKKVAKMKSNNGIATSTITQLDSCDQKDDVEYELIEKPIFHRQKLGELPAFIPID